MCIVDVVGIFFFFKQKTAYEMRISDWSSDVCSSDLAPLFLREEGFRISGLAERKPGRCRPAQIILDRLDSENLDRLRRCPRHHGLCVGNPRVQIGRLPAGRRAALPPGIYFELQNRPDIDATRSSASRTCLRLLLC